MFFSGSLFPLCPLGPGYGAPAEPLGVERRDKSALKELIPRDGNRQKGNTTMV